MTFFIIETYHLKYPSEHGHDSLSRHKPFVDLPKKNKANVTARRTPDLAEKADANGRVRERLVEKRGYCKKIINYIIAIHYTYLKNILL